MTIYFLVKKNYFHGNDELENHSLIMYITQVSQKNANRVSSTRNPSFQKIIFLREDFTLDEVLKKSEEKRQSQEFLATEPSRNT